LTSETSTYGLLTLQELGWLAGSAAWRSTEGRPPVLKMQAHPPPLTIMQHARDCTNVVHSLCANMGRHPVPAHARFGAPLLHQTEEGL